MSLRELFPRGEGGEADDETVAELLAWPMQMSMRTHARQQDDLSLQNRVFRGLATTELADAFTRVRELCGHCKMTRQGEGPKYASFGARGILRLSAGRSIRLSRQRRRGAAEPLR